MGSHNSKTMMTLDKDELYILNVDKFNIPKKFGTPSKDIIDHFEYVIRQVRFRYSSEELCLVEFRDYVNELFNDIETNKAKILYIDLLILLINCNKFQESYNSSIENMIFKLLPLVDEEDNKNKYLMELIANYYKSKLDVVNKVLKKHKKRNSKKRKSRKKLKKKESKIMIQIKVHR